MLNKKAFTLIELLAVILILGIIALIAIPMVNSIINESKKESFKVTTRNLMSAVETKCQMQQLNGENITIEYNFYPTGVDSTLDIKGKLPTTGFITISSSCDISAVEVSRDNYTAILEDGKIKILDEKISYETYNTGDLVFFDPVSDETCNSSTFKLDLVKNGTSTCYKWRVIETEDSNNKHNITLQMDHNLVNLSAWSPALTLTGPVTALESLGNETSSWERVNNLNYIYDTTTTANKFGKMACVNGTCIINNNTVNGTLKARLITGEEIKNIVNKKVIDESAISKTWTIATPSYYYFSKTDYEIGTQTEGTGDTSLSWLLENTKVNASSLATSNEYGDTNRGYWTLSSFNTNTSAWHINHTGYIIIDSNSKGDAYGARPVITVLKKLITM